MIAVKEAVLSEASVVRDTILVDGEGTKFEQFLWMVPH